MTSVPVPCRLPSGRRAVGIRFVVWTAIALAIVALATPASARADSVAIESLEVGLDGYYVIGNWRPISITRAGGSEPATGRFEVTLRDGDGTPCTYPVDRPVQLVPGHSKRVWCYVPFGNPDATVHVAFLVVD